MQDKLTINCDAILKDNSPIQIDKIDYKIYPHKIECHKIVKDTLIVHITLNTTEVIPVTVVFKKITKINDIKIINLKQEDNCIEFKLVIDYEVLDEPLTLEWIISTLKKSGVNSKQAVIDRLEKAHCEEIKDLINDLVNEIIKGERLPF